MTSHTAIETLIWLTHDAFEGDPNHSLLANLKDVREDEWTAFPPGGGRAIGDILEHVGWSKWMYEDVAFGTGTMRGDAPPIIPARGARSRPHVELLDWLREGHARWHKSLQSLEDDNELEVERMSTWGDRLPTRTLARILIAHDFYHAGEINHLRAVLNGTDRWPYDEE